ncbi:MMPL family transporter [Bacillus altitudinis]|uniref:MMPL family transporter n=1 Tax=Bacillus altitudinis TaxID=293387 RepID=UPI0019335F84|nr:MMPL family transporter [Bacillus altitudinis]MED1424475.1 MMPL family transporter [Bacillus altitudinis]QRF84133.1 MMPL family transporter [Bacillus altitudinis]
MAKFLYHLGKSAFSKPKRMIIGWLLVLVAVVAATIGTGVSFNGDMSIPGTKSEKAMGLLEKKFPAGDDGGTIRLIFKAPKGETLETKKVRNKLNETIKEVKKDKAVKQVTDLYQTFAISKDKKIGYADITYRVKADEVKTSSKEKVLDSIKISRKAGIQTELGGSVTFSEIEVGGISEVIGIVMAFFILAFTFASLLIAGLPILTAVIGLIIGVMVILITSNFVEMSAFSLTLAVMIGLAVGIDYALFIISRYRQLLAEGYELKEAAARAVATAGSAVLFAGVTVVIALCGLVLVGIPFLGVMGLVAAFMVLSVMLVSLTIVPAILGILGDKVSPSRKNKWFSKLQSQQKEEATAWGRFIKKYPGKIILGVIVLTGLLSWPALHMELGLPDNGMKGKETTERKGYDLLAEGFGKGFNGPLVVIIDASHANNAMKSIEKTTKVLEKMDGIKQMAPPVPNPSGKYAMLTILPKSGPEDKATKQLVKDIRNESSQTAAKYDTKLLVTGSTAVNIDISDRLSEALPKFAGVIIGFALILMILVFRSFLVPLKAVLGFLMTLTATLGFSVFVLQDGHLAPLFGIPANGPLLNFMPVLVTGILFGLAMDYEVFLVSRMREDFLLSGDAKKSVVSGLKHSGRVVTAAGLIMIFVFASFIFADDLIIKTMGLTLAFGVLFDAFVIRMTFIPACMMLIGRAAWYLPKWFERWLPRIDIEGESISQKDEKEEKVI